MKDDRPTLEQIKKWADRFLTATHRMVTGPNTYKEKLVPRIVEAAFRRDYLTLYTIRHLADGKPEEQVAFGSSCMDLSRRVLEDLVSLEYMFLKGKEKMAEKFRDYLAVQDKLDLEYYQASGLSIGADAEKTINDAYDAVKKEFLDKSNKSRWKAWQELAGVLKEKGMAIDMEDVEKEFDKKYPSAEETVRKNWAGLDVEAMIIELVRADKISGEDEKRSLLQTYKMGNNKNHFSPQDLLMFLFNDMYEETGKGDMNLSLLVTTMSLVKIAQIFISEFDVPEETTKEIDAIWQELLVAHLPKK